MRLIRDKKFEEVLPLLTAENINDSVGDFGATAFMIACSVTPLLAFATESTPKKDVEEDRQRIEDFLQFIVIQLRANIHHVDRMERHALHFACQA